MTRSLYPKIDFPPEAAGWPPAVVHHFLEASSWLSGAYNELIQLLGPEIARSHALSLVAPEDLKRKKGAHDAAYNAELALTYELAPDGQKKDAAAEVARRYKREASAALKQVRRIQKRGLTWQELAAAPADLYKAYVEAREKSFGEEVGRDLYGDVHALKGPGQMALSICPSALAASGTYVWGELNHSWSNPR